MPVALAILRLAFVMPNARFQLKDNPGIPVFDPRLLDIGTTSKLFLFILTNNLFFNVLT